MLAGRPTPPLVLINPALTHRGCTSTAPVTTTALATRLTGHRRLRIHGFHIRGFNQPWMENLKKAMQMLACPV